MLGWRTLGLPDSANSPKPQALRVPSCRRAGLDRIRSASSQGTCASQAKKAKGVALVLLPRDPRYAAGEILPPSVTDHAPVLVKCLRSYFAETTVHGWRRCAIPRESQTRLIFPGWLCWSVIHLWDFPKPQALRVSAYQRSGLDKIPLPDFTKGEPPGENQPALFPGGWNSSSIRVRWSLRNNCGGISQEPGHGP